MKRTHGFLKRLVLILNVFLLMIFSNTLAQGDANDIAVGIWKGALDIGGNKLTVIFHISKTDSNTLSGAIDSPDQGAMGIPISKVTVVDDSLAVEVAAIGGAYQGKISSEKNQIEGKWMQMGAALPLTLSKTTTAVELNRPQEPKPPFPYKSEEVTYTNTPAGIKLSGTLTLPESGGPFAAVILITGSGPQDRNETVFGHRPFLVISDYLTRRGIAVLRVDDRGVGGSSGNVNNVTSADLATDVLAGVAFLKNRGDINPKKIGLVGHSEGGIIAPIVAAQSSDVAFIVLLAGTGFNGETVINKQLALIEKASNTPEEQISKDVERNVQMFSIIKSAKDSAAAAEKLRNYFKSTISEWGAPLLKSGIDPEKTIDSQINAVNTKWYKFFLTYDPKPTLEKVKCPVLAMGGKLDLQVPAVENLQAIKNALREGGNKDFSIELLPGLNHTFQHAKTGAPAEYAQIEETFAPEALQIMGDWIEKHVKN